jgi:NADH:ubiquinone oxidoreductase subunit F (NADH-binding)
MTDMKKPIGYERDNKGAAGGSTRNEGRVGVAHTNSMKAKQWDKPLLQELSQGLMDASICGLGQAAPNPMLSVMKYFPKEVGDA